MKLKYIFIFLLAILIHASCTQISQSFKDTFKEENADEESEMTNQAPLKDLKAEEPEEEEVAIEEEIKIEEPRNFLSDSAALAEAQRKLLNLPTFRGKDVKFYSSIHFYENGRVKLNLRMKKGKYTMPTLRKLSV